jgi:ferric-chelate reductase
MVYPLILVLFLTMSRNVKAYLQCTVLAEYIPLTSMHNLHIWAGTLVGVISMWHGLWHLIRWGVQGNLRFLIATPTGISGLICVVVMPLIVWPMRLAYLRKIFSFEVRKQLHYLSWVWMGSLIFHAPNQDIFWIAGAAFLIYLVDWLYGLLWSTRMAPSARFVRFESAVMIRVPKPTGFTLKGAGGAYCYLCVPWVSKFEWHAFSVFQDPFDVDCICFCIALKGDWTQKLHDDVYEPLSRRLWLYGPFPSPFESAMDNDNVISIATGIGITPALSVIKSLADHRKMHLIWIVREASLLEFMIDYGITFDQDAYTLIFYTGERELVFRRELPFNVFLFKGRPEMDKLILSLIQMSICQKEVDLSNYEMIYEHKAAVAERQEMSIEHCFYAEISRLLLTYSVRELFHFAVRRSNVNSPHVTFQGLKDLINDIFVRNFSKKELRRLFNLADMDPNGAINLNEFHAFIGRLEENAAKHNDCIKQATQKPFLEKNQSIIFPVADMNQSIRVARPEHWRLMYCGGSSQVLRSLQAVSSKHRIPLSIESFEW